MAFGRGGRGAVSCSWGDVRPKRVRPAETSVDANGEVRVAVLVPRFGGGWLDALMRPFGFSAHRVKLDALGSLTWELCDGTKSVREIGAALVERFGESVAPIEERLPRFLTQMVRARLVELIES